MMIPYHKKKQYCTYWYSILFPYFYRQNKYPNSFLNRLVRPRDVPSTISKNIYCFWTGDNEITDNRKRCLDMMIKKCGVDVVLVTSENLDKYILPGYDIHPAYPYLSYNHRSDYLRCYFMHHYGGGFSDIKEPNNAWNLAFDKLERSKAWVLGYPEIGWYGAASEGTIDPLIKMDLQNYWRLLLGNGAYICKSNTGFTSDWFAEINNRLDLYLPQLKEHPARDPFGTNKDYPIPWTDLGGNIFHPLCLKYNRKLIKDRAVMPSFENYR